MADLNEHQQGITPLQIRTHIGQFTGMNNLLPRTDLRLTDMWQVTNVDLDRNGDTYRRDGYTLVLSGNWSSFWSNGVLRYGVRNGDLVKVNRDNTVTVARFGVGTAKMSFTNYGATVFYSNGSVIGYVIDATDYAFSAPTDAYMAAPLPGQILGMYKGSLCVCRGGEIWPTEPLLFNHVDMRYRVISFKDDITMFAPVDDGIWVATANEVYFLSGPSARKLTKHDVFSYGNPTGAVAEIDSSKLNDGSQQGKVVMFPTTNGVCWGGNGGAYVNITGEKYIMPSGNKGAAIYRAGDINQVVITVH